MPVILISGASRGIGLEFTAQYASEGWDVIAACRSPQKADKLQALAGKYKNLSIETLEVTDTKSIAAMADRLKEKPIDILINNAGIITGSTNRDDGTQDFGSIDPDAWDKVLRTNTIAPIMVSEAFLPHLKRGQLRKLVFITSKMGSIAEMGSGYIAYRTSKTALNAAMVAISYNLKNDKISTVVLHPGWVKTDMGGQGALIDTLISVTGMRKVISELSLANTGQFYEYSGKALPW